jgi:ribose transport system substrate-binding protein
MTSSSKFKTAAMSAVAMVFAMSSTIAHASDNKIALVPGGPHPYFAPWTQAAQDAKKDFGIAVVDFKVPAERKLNLQTELLESLMSQGYNGFGIFPGDAVGINSTLDEMDSNGVPSVTLAGCAKAPTKAVMCMSTDNTAKATSATKALIKAIGGKGKIVHLAGPLIDVNTKVIMAAVEKAVADTNGAVQLIQTVGDTDSQETGDQKINALLGAQKDQIDGIIASGYLQTVIATKALRNVGDKRIKLVGIDDDPSVLDGIKDGFVEGTLAQNPYGQGYLGAYALDLLAGGKCKVKADAPFLKTPDSDQFIDTGTIVVTKANVDTYKDELKKMTKEIAASFKDKYLTCK